MKPFLKKKMVNSTFYVAGTKIIGATSMEDMISKLKRPRRVMLLVKAGAAVDAFIDKLVNINRCNFNSLCMRPIL